MEKKKAHYDLLAIVADVRKLRAAAFTKAALDGGRRMGFTSAEMIDVVCSLSNKHLYKSMTTNADSRVWQDVYHAKTIWGVVYIKVTRREDGPPVIQFKEL
ncbi:type II toxin-antitoxin system MqsR family toxin [Rhizobium sp. FKL33]|uniref:type II toxin-antitoxin system MqsR family toxin n=1 Tax=Rhizobium sp. FKL33 TaxID=2562307 RepID=UPI0010BF9F3F|nr:type II toxin-antitoxin system MqsR family toxin [Rhizobium sp. FKL33]